MARRLSDDLEARILKLHPEWAEILKLAQDGTPRHSISGPLPLPTPFPSASILNPGASTPRDEGTNTTKTPLYLATPTPPSLPLTSWPAPAAPPALPRPSSHSPELAPAPSWPLPNTRAAYEAVAPAAAAPPPPQFSLRSASPSIVPSTAATMAAWAALPSVGATALPFGVRSGSPPLLP
eukprot:EG_transcript_34659